MDKERYDSISKLLETYHGKKEQYSDETYNELIDFKQISKSDSIEHRNKRYYEVEGYLSLHEWSVYFNRLRQYEDKKTPLEILNCIHNIYNFTKQDVIEICKILGRATPKRRTLTLYGPSNCGKSLLANALLYPWAPGYIQRDGGTNVHWLEHIYRKSFILWEEPSIHMTNVEDTKLLCGGEKLAINRKNKNIIERLNDPAVIITTNRQVWEYDPSALKNRMLIYTLNNEVDSVYKGYLKPQQIIRYLTVVHDGRL